MLKIGVYGSKADGEKILMNSIRSMSSSHDEEHLSNEAVIDRALSVVGKCHRKHDPSTVSESSHSITGSLLLLLLLLFFCFVFCC